MKHNPVYNYMRHLILLTLILLTASCSKNIDDCNVDTTDYSANLPVLTTIAVTDITSASAKAIFTISDDGGFKIFSSGVCWSTSENPTVHETKILAVAGTGAETYVNISGLLPATTYYLRAFATNSAGIAYGNTIVFETIEAELPIVTTNPISNITSEGAVGGGTIISDGGAEVIERGVVWGINPNPGVELPTKTIDGTGPGDFTSIITNLAPTTRYYVRAYATNHAGTSYGSEITFETLSASFTDPRDGSVYQTVKIGNQIWMAENLRYLPHVSDLALGSVETPFRYVHSYSGINVEEAKATDNYINYGALYNWAAAQDACPSGWHLPSEAEFTVLIEFLGGESIAGAKMKQEGTLEEGTSLWRAPNTGATNESGFTGLPGGRRHSSGGSTTLGFFGNWWTRNEVDSNEAKSYILFYNVQNIHTTNSDKSSGFSIRCIKD